MFIAKDIVGTGAPPGIRVSGPPPKSGSAEAKSMKQGKVREKIDAAVEDLARELESGGSKTLQRYLEAMAKFHRCSYQNAILIHVQKPDATRVAGYRAWQKLGRQVKKGEKAIYILAPIVKRRKAEEKDDREKERDEEENDEEPQPERRVVGFTTACVFDISQTEGEPLPEPVKVRGKPGLLLKRLKDFAAKKDIGIEYPAHFRTIEGASAGGTVQLRPDLEPPEEFSTLAHELAHELLHTEKPEDRRRSKTVEETEAEAVAHVVCHAAGLDVNTSSSDYICLYRGDPDTLTASLKRIRKAASTMLRHVLPEPRKSAATKRNTGNSQAPRECPPTG